jgi:hypothetical protein
MSTRSSMVYSPEFHFYHDLQDEEEGDVHLDLRGKGRITIPAAIWATIRQYGAVDVSLAPLTDDDLLAKVTAEVDERIQDYTEASDGMKPFYAFVGSAAFGSAAEEREAQIAEGMKTYKALRERQFQIVQKMGTHTSAFTHNERYTPQEDLDEGEIKALASLVSF